MKKITITTLFLTALFLVATFLRSFRLEEFTTFLSDQGRDAIVMKHIVTFEHLTAIGPPSSIGQVLLGPFYYYMIAPFLLLFHFNPIGMTYGVLLYSLVGLALSFYVVRKNFDSLTSTLFAVFVTFSAVNIDVARFSWNPNLLPLFAFFTLYCFYQFLESKKLLYAFLAGLLFGLSVQLHHLAFLMGPAMLIYFFVYLKSYQKIPSIRNWLTLFGSFIVGYSPLIFFDLKHQFVNTRTLLNLFLGGQFVAKSSFFDRLTAAIQNFFSHVFAHQFSVLSSLGIMTLLVISYGILKKQKKVNHFIELNYIMIFTYIFLFCFLNSQNYPHYFASIYFSFYLVFSYLVSKLPKKKVISWLIIGVFVLLYVKSQGQKYYFFHQIGNHQIKIADAIAQSIVNRDPQSPYQIAGLPFTEPEGHIRYFLELKGKRPLDADSPEEAKQLFVLCHETNCQPLANPLYQIAAFRNGKIIDTWQIYGVTIYKAVHVKPR